jgi:HEAT repeat protein
MRNTLLAGLILTAPLIGFSPVYSSEAGAATAATAASSEAHVDAKLLEAARAANQYYQRKVESLVALLESPEQPTRVKALKHLGELYDTAITGYLLPWMQASNRTSEEIIMATCALTDEGCAIAIPVLRQLLKHDDANVRANAMNGLTRAKLIETIDYMPRLTDTEPALRASSATNLGLMKTADASAILLKTLILDGRSHVRRMCVIALGQIGNREHGPAIADALTDPNAGVRRYAAEALVKLNYTPAIPNLLMAMEGNIAGDHIARSLQLMTNQDFGFSSRANPLARTEAVERGFKWWNENAKELNQ